MQSRTDVLSRPAARSRRISSRASPGRTRGCFGEYRSRTVLQHPHQPAIARYVPSLAEAAARVFSLGDEKRLASLFEAAAFRDVEITTEIHRFALPSFDAYFKPFEQGAGSPGQAFVSLSEDARHAVREEVLRMRPA